MPSRFLPNHPTSLVMKNYRLLLLALFAVGTHFATAQVVDTTYTTDTDIGVGTSFFLEGASGGSTATWTINPGITVSGGRFFIGSSADPDDGPATFVVDGGGTLDITRTGIFNLRLGQDNASEAGILVIRNGSTVKLTGTTAGAFAQAAGSFMELNGVGSTFTSVGTWNAGTSQFTSQTGVSGGTPITVNVVGGVIAASVSGTFTTLTVLAAPPDPVLSIANPPTIQSNGSPVNVSVPFTNTGATLPLTLTTVTPGGADSSYFAVTGFTSPVNPGDSGTIDLTFTPLPGSDGPYVADLTILSNDSANPSQTILLNAAVADPGFSINVAQVDFGTLAANPGATTASVTITNTGANSNLTINAALLGAADGFTLGSLPGPIAPGASANIEISFNPGSAAGHFGSLLSISSNAFYSGSAILPVIAQVTPGAALPTSLNLVNGDFEANAYNSQNSTAPDGWTSSLVGTAGNYGQNNIPNIAPGIPALFWSRGGNFIQQDLSTSNSGLTADQLTGVQLSFERGYRNDVVTKGDILVRLSLWDLTTDTEVAGRDVVIEDTGVKTGVDRNQLTATGITLPITGASANPVALRISTVEPVLAAGQFEATAIIDNVSVAVSGSYNPSTPFQTWALANGLDGTTGKEDGPADDPDQDGASNFEEFAFGANPLSGSSGSLTGVVTADTTADSQPELLLTLAVRTGASFSGSPSPTATLDGVIYTIQGSANLGTFDQIVEGPLASPVIPASLPLSPPTGYEYLTFRLAGSNGLPSRGFLRAVAVETP
jgi:hypothetical protein